MRNILALVALALGLVLSLGCGAASNTSNAENKLESDYHPIPAGPISDYSAERIRYIQRVVFLFRKNLDLAHRHEDSRIPGNIVQQPEAAVRLYFSAKGKLERYEIERGSGDPSFDLAVGFILQKSIPELPPPPLPSDDKPFSFLVRVCAAC